MPDRFASSRSSGRGRVVASRSSRRSSTVVEVKSSFGVEVSRRGRVQLEPDSRDRSASSRLRCRHCRRRVVVSSSTPPLSLPKIVVVRPLHSVDLSSSNRAEAKLGLGIWELGGRGRTAWARRVCVGSGNWEWELGSQVETRDDVNQFWFTVVLQWLISLINLLT